MTDIAALDGVAAVQGPAVARLPLQVRVEHSPHAHQPQMPGVVDSLAAAADRWRTEFDAAQKRLTLPHGGSALELAMNRSLQIQAEIFRVSAGIHIGLSANQQTQGAVRTLVEKS